MQLVKDLRETFWFEVFCRKLSSAVKDSNNNLNSTPFQFPSRYSVLSVQKQQLPSKSSINFVRSNEKKQYQIKFPRRPVYSHHPSLKWQMKNDSHWALIGPISPDDEHCQNWTIIDICCQNGRITGNEAALKLYPTYYHFVKMFLLAIMPCPMPMLLIHFW